MAIAIPAAEVAGEAVASGAAGTAAGGAGETAAAGAAGGMGKKPKAKPKPADGGGDKGGDGGGKKKTPEGGGKGGGGAKGKAKKTGAARGVAWAWSGKRRLLTMQFVACMVVLGLGTLLAPKGSNDGMTRAMVKGSGLAGLFFILALVASGGKGPAKAATALGTLVTAAYVLTSSDVRNVVGWFAEFFKPGGDVSDPTKVAADIDQLGGQAPDAAPAKGAPTVQDGAAQ